ncbi:copper homeostasis protein CutC, partial [Clostridioides difficile]
KEDISIMQKDIGVVKEVGANGVVFGVLDKNNNIDEKNLNVLLAICLFVKSTSSSFRLSETHKCVNMPHISKYFNLNAFKIDLTS